MRDIIVLKFGSSVLRTAADLPLACAEIAREVARHRAVIAVVSAFAGVTDALFAQARQNCLDLDAHALAGFVARGEQHSADLLARSLSDHGLGACVAQPHALGLRAEGDALDATLCALDAHATCELLARSAAIVVPGFIACDAQARTLLLGRGGSDLSALFLAQGVGGHCRLLKDVDGVYESDPAKGLARRYATVTWQHALAVAGELLQPKAVSYAELNGFEFEVSAAGAAHGTLVGRGPNRFSQPGISRDALLPDAARREPRAIRPVAGWSRSARR